MPLLLGFSAYMLERAFKQSLLTAEEDALLTHTYSMMAVAEPDEGFLFLPENLTDSRFNDPDSGLYAQVIDDDFGPIWQSISLDISPYNQKIPFEEIEMGNLHIGTATIEGKEFFISRYDTVWEIDNQDREYQFSVIHSQNQFISEITRYRTTLASWLTGLAVLLIIIQTVIIRWGLLPLRRLAHDIEKLETGGIDSLDSNYPNEILPVTQNINHLIESESLQRTRYKNTLGDLAHSLKTPLTVIRSMLENLHATPNNIDSSKVSIDEQVVRMNDIITHQLNRATQAKASFQANTKLHPIVTRIYQALSKVYQEKNIHFESFIEDTLEYPAQEDDLMEVLGNLLENAFKYGSKRVHISALKTRDILKISIEDDGEGVPEDKRQSILERGSRADTRAPGQGIGLAVATDIISTYDGGLNVEKSTMGGAMFIVELTY